TLRQLLVRAVHWVARLERHDVLAPARGQQRAHLRWGAAELAEVPRRAGADDAQRPADAAAPPAAHLRDERMARVARAEDRPLVDALEDILDRHHAEDLVLGAAQGDVAVE